MRIFSVSMPRVRDSCRCTRKKSPQRALHFRVTYTIKLYDLLDLPAPKATSTDLDSARRTLDQSLDCHKIRAECAFCGYANVLAYAAFLLGLTFSWNTISCNRSFSANLTSTSHSYIHLIQINSFVGRNGACQSHGYPCTGNGSPVSIIARLLRLRLQP